jgi:hypothetical protein
MEFAPVPLAAPAVPLGQPLARAMPLQPGRVDRSPRPPARRSPGRAPAPWRAAGRGCAARTWCVWSGTPTSRPSGTVTERSAGLRSAATDDRRPAAAGGRSRSPPPSSRAADRAGPCAAAAAAPRAPPA